MGALLSSVRSPLLSGVTRDDGFGGQESLREKQIPHFVRNDMDALLSALLSLLLSGVTRDDGFGGHERLREKQIPHFVRNDMVRCCPPCGRLCCPV